MSKLYVKTDGPVPRGMPITAGKVYRCYEDNVNDPRIGMSIITDDMELHHIHFESSAMLDYSPWTFCDQHGTPVPAPWEDEADVAEKRHQAQTQQCALDTALSSEVAPIPMPPIDYRAHAERLAEALEKADSGFASLNFLKTSPVRARIAAALSAYNQTKEST